MMRTRLVWFAVGFSVSAAAISYFVWKDLLSHRHALSNHMKNEFDALEQRLNNLDSLSNPEGIEA